MVWRHSTVAACLKPIPADASSPGPPLSHNVAYAEAEVHPGVNDSCGVISARRSPGSQANGRLLVDASHSLFRDMAASSANRLAAPDSPPLQWPGSTFFRFHPVFCKRPRQPNGGESSTTRPQQAPNNSLFTRMRL